MRRRTPRPTETDTLCPYTRLCRSRSNCGGSRNEWIELTGLFIDQGPVVQVRESGGRVSVEGDRDAGVAWDGPLAVLVNRGSASESEIFAGEIGRAHV